MDKELCFCIEGRNLYLEQGLVDYMDIPIFFLCRDDKQFYVSLCTDIDELTYIIVKVSDDEVYRLLHGQIPMRNIFLNQTEYWEVLSGEEISSDLVERYSITQLDNSVLPEEDACFEVLTEEIELYVHKFDNEFWGVKNFDCGEIKIELDKISADDFIDILGETIEEFINLGSYFLKARLNSAFDSVIALSEEYVAVSSSYVRKTEAPQYSQHLEKWKNDDVMNEAA